MAESGEQNLNSDLPGLRRSHLYIFNHQWLIWFISNSSYFQFHPNRSQSNPTFVLVQIEIHYKMFIIRWWRKKEKVPLQVITWPRVAMDLIWEPQNLRREKDYYKEKGPNEAAYIVIYTYKLGLFAFFSVDQPIPGPKAASAMLYRVDMGSSFILLASIVQ